MILLLAASEIHPLLSAGCISLWENGILELARVSALSWEPRLQILLPVLPRKLFKAWFYFISQLQGRHNLALSQVVQSPQINPCKPALNCYYALNLVGSQWWSWEENPGALILWLCFWLCLSSPVWVNVSQISVVAERINIIADLAPVLQCFAPLIRWAQPLYFWS